MEGWPEGLAYSSEDEKTCSWKGGEFGEKNCTGQTRGTLATEGWFGEGRKGWMLKCTSAVNRRREIGASPP
jgi:hypothetical protein